MVSVDKEALYLYPEKIKIMIKKGGYTSQIIFNMDETGYSGRRFLKKLLSRIKTIFPGFKVVKDRLTVMVGANVAEKCNLKPLLVHRSEKGFKKLI